MGTGGFTVENSTITLGSLFDGAGTMPLCAEEEPDGLAVWASEVEPYHIAVTKTHLPHMRHLGSVTEINGAEIEPVDIITFGSPCQAYAEEIVIPKFHPQAIETRA